jgi:hypothetical protein
VIVVENNSDNSLVTFRFKNPSVKMSAAEDAFTAMAAASRRARSSSRTRIARSSIRRSSRSASRPLPSRVAPSVKTHDSGHSAHRLHPQLDAHAGRRLGSRRARYVRRAYQYFGENSVAKMGDLRTKFDVILYPHGGSGVGGGAGGRGGAAANIPVPYKSTKEFPSLGFPDSTDDVRGALGEDGMKALYAFIQKGGTLITEGNTSRFCRT